MDTVENFEFLTDKIDPFAIDYRDFLDLADVLAPFYNHLDFKRRVVELKKGENEQFWCTIDLIMAIKSKYLERRGSYAPTLHELKEFDTGLEYFVEHQKYNLFGLCEWQDYLHKNTPFIWCKKTSIDEYWQECLEFLKGKIISFIDTSEDAQAVLYNSLYFGENEPLFVIALDYGANLKDLCQHSEYHMFQMLYHLELGDRGEVPCPKMLPVIFSTLNAEIRRDLEQNRARYVYREWIQEMLDEHHGVGTKSAAKK